MENFNIIFRVMILEILQKSMRLFLGYVMFEASGGFPDRFFDSCKQNGINLFDVRRVDGRFYACVKISDYKKMHRIRKNSDMSLKIKEKHGLPFVLYKRRNRIGLLIGAVLFIILLWFLSGSLWSISVEGNRDVDENDIIKAFEESGVAVGARIGKIDITAAENRVSTQIPELVWVSLNISGTVATVKVREGSKVPEIPGDEKPCNIIAKYGGQISTYEVYEGTAEQEINSAVAKGDLLISGIITYKDGTTVLRPARGKVLAKTNRRISFVPDKDFKMLCVKDIRKLYTLDFFRLSFMLPTDMFLGDEYLMYGKLKKTAFVNDRDIPVSLSEDTAIITKAAELDDLRKKSIAFDSFLKEVRSKTDIESITDVEIAFEKSGDFVSVVGDFSMTEDICEVSELLYTESQ